MCGGYYNDHKAMPQEISQIKENLLFRMYGSNDAD